jgi:two-component system chemotaxis response regulator CheB
MSRVRVLIVDDSPTMRSLIGAVLRRDPEIEVVARRAIRWRRGPRSRRWNPTS